MDACGAQASHTETPAAHSHTPPAETAATTPGCGQTKGIVVQRLYPLGVGVDVPPLYNPYLVSPRYHF